MAHKDKEKNRLYVAQWRKDHPEQAMAIRRRYVEKNRDKVKASTHKYRLRSIYGLTVDEYDRMIEEQRGGCAICFEQPAPGRRLHIDHDHRTGAVRGLLCEACNHAIGNFKDNPLNLARAIDYLRLNEQQPHDPSMHRVFMDGDWLVSLQWRN